MTDLGRTDRHESESMAAAVRVDGCATDAQCAIVPIGAQPGGSDDGGLALKCAACVARPTSLAERLVALETALIDETEPLVTVTHLLQLCRDEHPVLWERLNDRVTSARVAVIVAEARRVLPAASTVAVLSQEVRCALVDALTAAGEVPAVVVARALAELLDERYAHSFDGSFRNRSPYQPGVGDPLPLDSPDLRLVTALPATSPPWRLANRLDETRHVRLAGEWTTQFRVIFDYGLAGALTGLIGPDTIVATCHPNSTLGEFEFPLDAQGRTFPVRPADEPWQHHVIDKLISAAVTAGASIVVLPELCVTETLAAQLQEWTCRPDGPRLLVAGSYHQEDTHLATEHDPLSLPTRRRNTAVAYLRGCPSALTHDKHSPADRPVNEDIQPQGWPQLRVYVSDDGWHLVIAICRDLLNPHAVHAMAEAGVNLVLVPAMSETLVAFGGPVAHLVGSAQAFVAVANNPADFSIGTELTARRPARALFGHPGFGRQTRLVQPAGDEPGMALMRLQTGQLQWLPEIPVQPRRPNRGGAATGLMLPLWATRLAQRIGTSRPQSGWQANGITLRPSAVLVLLTDGETGPEVLLTQRAADLTHYPGQLVFPGGAAEPGDHGPVGTALREAAEEVGLDAASVQILGTLPAIALLDSGFLMTPVLAWSPRPVDPDSVNLAEVTAVVTVAVRHLPCVSVGPQWSESAGEGTTVDTQLGALGAVTRVVVDQLSGMLAGGAGSR